MTQETPEKQSQLIGVLREGVSVVQMILFKELRKQLTAHHPDREPAFLAMLTGTLVNEIFASPNMEERFVTFRMENHALIEQELLSVKEHQTTLLPALTDTLRILSLCDNQEGIDSSHILTRANELGLLAVDRPVPMPSTFMTLVRGLGEQHGLIIAPVQITPEEDRTIH